jgi:hypothetical protein
MLASTAGLLLLAAPAADESFAASLSLYVSFFANGTISVTLPDGSQLGTTSGTPPVIPAGYYTLVFSGPGGCTSLPYFHLTGPGTSVATNMAEGAAGKTTNAVNLQPNSTYVWSSDAFPGVLHSFTTSAVVEGSPPSPGTSGGNGGNVGKGVTYPDLVGSAIVPFRGTLTAAISAAGRLSLAYKGRSVASLRAGKYRIAVRDGSANAGFVLGRLDRPSVSITGDAFMGTRSASVRLTPGRWVFAVTRHRTRYSIPVR